MQRTAADRLINQLQLLRIVYKYAQTSSQIGSHSTTAIRLNPLITRSYVRQAPKSRPETTIKPLEPVRTGAKLKAQDRAPQSFRYIDEMEPELIEDIKNLKDDDLEPDINSLHLDYEMYQREKHALYLKTRRLSATRKHYKEFLQPEISLLTYAEKEKIRYLHATANWTPEMIADAFPITTTGADKLLHCKFKLHTDKEIIEHDRRLVRRLQKIEAGELEVEPDLEKSLAKRSAQTLFVGAKWNPDHFIDGLGGFDMSDGKPKREPGEFERLVTIPPEGKKKAKVAQQSSELQIAAPTPIPKSSPKPSKSTDPKSKRDSFEDEVEGVRDIRSIFPDFDGGEDERRFQAMLSKRNPQKKYTLAEFERIFKSNP